MTDEFRDSALERNRCKDCYLNSKLKFLLAFCHTGSYYDRVGFTETLL